MVLATMFMKDLERLEMAYLSFKKGYPDFNL